MVNKALLDVLMASGKRKNMLLMLKDGPLKMSSLLTGLKTNRQALLPQARMLEDSHLVFKTDDSYGLTTIGQLIVGRMIPVIDTVNVLESDIDYWGTHDLGFIPGHLLSRLDELGSCRIIEPKIYNFFELNKDFMESSMRSKSVRSFVSFLHPDHLQLFLDLLEKGVDGSFIATEELFEKVKADHSDDFREILVKGLIKFYVYRGKMDLVSFSLNDQCSVLRLQTKNHEYDSKQLFCTGPKALEWGKELFEYYRHRSTQVTSF